MKSWLLRLGHAATDNPLYRNCIRRRQALVGRQFDNRRYGFEHQAQQRFWGWWLDRFDMVAWHSSTLHSYLGLRREDVDVLMAQARYLGAVRQVEDCPAYEERVGEHDETT